jgi:hypothetical protein
MNAPAFPVTEENRSKYAAPGLTKREYMAVAFAAAVISGAVARGCPGNEWFDAPADGVRLADRMLLELAKQS